MKYNGLPVILTKHYISYYINPQRPPPVKQLSPAGLTEGSGRFR